MPVYFRSTGFGANMGLKLSVWRLGWFATYASGRHAAMVKTAGQLHQSLQLDVSQCLSRLDQVGSSIDTVLWVYGKQLQTTSIYLRTSLLKVSTAFSDQEY
jgi:hypothetical protein